MGYINFFFIVNFSFTTATDEGNYKVRGESKSYNLSITSTGLKNISQCRHEEQFKNGVYCDGYYEVYKIYGSGLPGDFGVNIFEKGFSPYIEWVDQGSRAECYSRGGSYGKIIIYLRYKSLITYPGGEVDVFSYNDTDIYKTTFCKS